MAVRLRSLEQTPLQWVYRMAHSSHSCLTWPRPGLPTTMWLLLGTRGQALPSGLAYNAVGDPTTDPAEVLAGGALRPFDRGPKGSGLALVAEILGGALVGGAVLDKMSQKNWGNLVLALDPAALGHGDQFPGRVRELLERVRGSSRADPSVPVRVPGERGTALAEERLEAGHIPLPLELYCRLVESAAAPPPEASGLPRPGPSPETLSHGPLLGITRQVDDGRRRAASKSSPPHQRGYSGTGFGSLPGSPGREPGGRDRCQGSNGACVI
eukprot:jgi/Botrbrau1/406/Bobra.110_2s0056.1